MILLTPGLDCGCGHRVIIWLIFARPETPPDLTDLTDLAEVVITSADKTEEEGGCSDCDQAVTAGPSTEPQPRSGLTASSLWSPRTTGLTPLITL